MQINEENYTIQTMPKVQAGSFTKSFYYDEPLHSEAVASDVALRQGQAFKLDGFKLLNVSYEGGYTLEFSRGSFVSNGIAVEIKDKFTLQIPSKFTYSDAARIPSFFIYGYTDNQIEKVPVHIEYTEKSLGSHEALIGVFYPGIVSTDAYFNSSDKRDSTKTWKWLPSPNGKIENLAGTANDLSAHFDDLGKQWTKVTPNTTATTTPDVTFAETHDWAYQFDMDLPSEDDLHSMFFCNGRLLQEGVDYIRQSPGSMLVWGSAAAGENPYFTSEAGIATGELTSGSFSCLFTENIKWRYETAFNGEHSNIVQIPANDLEGLRDGTMDCLIFTDGFLLPPNRYDLDRDTGTVHIKPRTDSHGESYWVTEEVFEESAATLAAVTDLISHITIVGINNLVGIDVLNDGTSAAIDGVEPSSSLKYLGNPGSNDLQVWVNGRLSYPDHKWSNTSHSAFDIYPDTEAGENKRQSYSEETAVDRVEVGSLPLTSRDLGPGGGVDDYGTYFGITSTFKTESYNSLVAVRFSAANTQEERLYILKKPFAFEELTGADLPAMIGRAIFNHPYYAQPLLASGHWAEPADPRASFSGDGAANGLEFMSGQNYFVTYDYLMGFSSDPLFPTYGYMMPGYDENSAKWPNKDLSVFASLQVELMEDVPPSVGSALMNTIEMLHTGLITEQNRAPESSTGESFVSTDTTGLYDKHVDPNEFFSDLNPITNLASLDSFLNKFSESFGFVLDNGDGTRDILSDAGTSYDLETDIGKIMKSFGAQLQGAARSAFGVKDDDTLVDVMNAMAGYGLTDIGYGWGSGYMWTNQFFNMEDGIFVHDPWSASHHYQTSDKVYAYHAEGDPDITDYYHNYGVALGMASASKAYDDSYHHIGINNTFDKSNISQGFYAGNKGFLSPTQPPISHPAGWPRSDKWGAGTLQDGGIMLPNDTYPGTGRSSTPPRYRDGVPTAHGGTPRNSRGYTAAIENFNEWEVHWGTGADSWRVHYDSHFRIGDRVYDRRAGTIHNHHITINPVHQLHDIGLHHYTEECDTWYGRDCTDTRYTQMTHAREKRRRSYFFKKKDNRFGFNLYGTHYSHDVNGHGRYAGPEYTAGTNYVGLSNILSHFFIFGPTTTDAPAHAGSNNPDENFYHKQ